MVKKKTVPFLLRADDGSSTTLQFVRCLIGMTKIFVLLLLLFLIITSIQASKSFETKDLTEELLPAKPPPPPPPDKPPPSPPVPYKPPPPLPPWPPYPPTPPYAPPDERKAVEEEKESAKRSTGVGGNDGGAGKLWWFCMNVTIIFIIVISCWLKMREDLLNPEMRYRAQPLLLSPRRYQPIERI